MCAKHCARHEKVRVKGEGKVTDLLCRVVIRIEYNTIESTVLGHSRNSTDASPPSSPAAGMSWKGAMTLVSKEPGVSPGRLSGYPNPSLT